MSTTSAQRMKKFRLEKQQQPDYNREEELERERKRISSLRQKQKKQLEKNSDKKKLEEMRKKEKLRKRQCRAMKRLREGSDIENDKHAERSIKVGKARRRQEAEKKSNEISSLKL